MNRNEWLLCDDSYIKWYWYNKAEQLKDALIYNKDPLATHKHHLMNTPEQIEYNTTHYEYWGFNQDGTFEYGKYIVFVTPEEHSKIHDISGENNPMYGRHWSNEERVAIGARSKAVWDAHPERKSELAIAMSGENNPMYGKPPVNKGVPMSDEQKEKIRAANLGKKASQETVKRLSDSHKGIKQSDNAKRLIGLASKERWSNPDYKDRVKESMALSFTDERRNAISNRLKGTHKSEECKRKISASNKVAWTSESRREQARIANTGENNPMYGKHLSDEHKKKISNALKGRKGNSLSKDSCLLISNAVKDRMAILSPAYKVYKENKGELSWNEFQKLDFDYIKSLLSQSDTAKESDQESAFWDCQ